MDGKPDNISFMIKRVKEISLSIYFFKMLVVFGNSSAVSFFVFYCSINIQRKTLGFLVMELDQLTKELKFSESPFLESPIYLNLYHECPLHGKLQCKIKEKGGIYFN